jgi:hypothetical protein
MGRSSFEGVPDAPVIALAHLVLKRAKLKLPCTVRAQALAIIRGIKPAPSKGGPLNIKPCNPQQAAHCRKCSRPITFSQPCHAFGNGSTDEHITCPRDVTALYSEALDQINWR